MEKATKEMVNESDTFNGKEKGRREGTGGRKGKSTGKGERKAPATRIKGKEIQTAKG